MGPKVIVFDLDFTLWDCGGTWIDCTQPPFKKKEDGEIYDTIGRRMSLYPDVRNILERLSADGYRLAVASRTEQPKWACEVLEMMDLHHYFEIEEIFPDSKLIHFREISAESRVSYQDMLFFDDEARNIREVSGLGVTSILVENGINDLVLEQGLSEWAKNNS